MKKYKFQSSFSSIFPFNKLIGILYTQKEVHCRQCNRIEHRSEDVHGKQTRVPSKHISHYHSRMQLQPLNVEATTACFSLTINHERTSPLRNRCLVPCSVTTEGISHKV